MDSKPPQTKKNIYFDQHLFDWDGKAKSILFSPWEVTGKSTQAIQLEAGINYTAIMNKFLKNVKKYIANM